MAGASRLMGGSRGRALKSDHLPSSSSSSARPSLHFLRSLGEKRILPSCRGEKRVAVSLEETATVITPQEHKKPLGIAQLYTFVAAEAARVALRLLGLLQPAAKGKRWSLQAEMLVERGIVGCRSFTLIAVAGSLIGSILCFVEGCFLVLESFFDYFHGLSQRLDQGGIIRLLIEAIDMFLVGTALLTFGMGLYVMFMGSNEMRQKPMAQSNLFGLFNLERLSECMDMKSISQAKSKIGHALLLILQSGVVEKFKNVPLTTGLDLACFAGAVFMASASVYLLSRLTMQRTRTESIHI